MTDYVEASFDSVARARTINAAIRYAGGSDEGWIQPSSSRLIPDPEGNLSTGALDAFGETSQGNSLTVTIGTGEALIGGAYLATDDTHDVTLSSSTNNQDVYVGWEDSVEDSVIVGTSSDFTSDDPKHKIWTFDTDSNGVSSTTDQRNTDNFRIRNEDVQALQAYTGDETTVSEALADGGNDEMDLDEFAGANGTNDQVPTSDGAAVTWDSISNLITDGDTDEIDAADFTGANGTSGQFLKTDGTSASWASPTVTGRYTGDGTTSQSITGVGFAPEVVWIWDSVTEGTGGTNIYVSTSQMGADRAVEIADGGAIDIETSRIISLDSDGFTVDDGGGDSDPNKNTKTYHYWAIA